MSNVLIQECARSFEGVMYCAYGDESADESKQRVFAIAGLLGSSSDWTIFRTRWRARTGGSIFHAAACDSDKAEYKPKNHVANKQLYADLANIIAGSNLFGIGVALSLPDYNALLGPTLEQNPYYFCFQQVVTALARRAALCIPQDNVKFTFDRNTEIEYNAGAIYDRIINQTDNKHFRQLMDDEIAFATRKTIGIQAADLLARETMKLMDNQLGPIKRPIRASTKALHTSRLINFIQYGTEECVRLAEEAPNYQYPKQDCLDWLAERRLPYTLANRLEYERIRKQLPKKAE